MVTASGTRRYADLNVTLNNVDSSQIGGITVKDDFTADLVNVTITGGSGITGDVTNSSTSALNINLDNSSITGNITGDNSGTITITATNGSIIQLNYLHLIAENYSTSNDMHITASDMDALQLRGGLVLGKTLALKNGGKLQNGTQSTRPNIDGTRAELGLGVIWQLD